MTIHHILNSIEFAYHLVSETWSATYTFDDVHLARYCAAYAERCKNVTIVWESVAVFYIASSNYTMDAHEKEHDAIIRASHQSATQSQVYINAVIR